MTTEVENLRVEDNAAENRFEVKVGGKFAFVTYHKSPGHITYYHTEVPPEFERRGLAKKLAVHVLDYARENNLQVNPLCPFIAAFIKRHPDYRNLLSAENEKRLFGG